MERMTLVVGGFALGLLLAVGGVWLLSDSSDPSERRPLDELAFPSVDHDPDAAADLLAAWERWRLATFVATGTWSRRLDAGGDPLTGPSYRAQDPPRRLVTRLGATVEWVDGSVSVCDDQVDVGPGDDVDLPDCVVGAASMDYDERVAREMVIVGGYVEGPSRLYDVARGDDGCFRAEIEVADLRSPWGRWAEFCFDGGTGALVSSRIRRPSAVDLEELVVLRATVTDADFEPAEG